MTEMTSEFLMEIFPVCILYDKIVVLVAGENLWTNILIVAHSASCDLLRQTSPLAYHTRSLQFE